MATSEIQLINKKRSYVWNHFTLLTNSLAKCNYCSEKKSFTGGSTGNLLRHMKTKHITVPLQRSIQIQEPNSEIVDDPQPSTSTSQPLNPTPSNLSSVRSSFSQSTLTNFVHRPLSLSKSKTIDHQLLKMIVKEYHPFSVVEDPEFRKLINMLSPTYTIPSRKTISNSLLPQLYETTVLNVKIQLNNVTAVCLTTDGWTSRNNQSFVAVTAHFINPSKDTELSAVLLGCNAFPMSHISENISSFLNNITKEWGLDDRISAVVTDNAINMKSAIEKCKWRHLSCFAHSINLIVHSGLEHIELIVVKVKNIVSFFKRSSHALAKLQELQKQTNSPILKLKQDCPTRWNSTYDMLDRVLKIRESIVATLAILNQNELNSINEHEWEVIAKSTVLLKIFVDVTTDISAEKFITVSKQIIFIKALLKYTQKFCDDITLPQEVLDVAMVLNQQIIKRFGRMDENALIAQSTILDPRFKTHGFMNADKSNIAIRQLRFKLQSIRTEQVLGTQTPQPLSSSLLPSANSDIWGEFDQSVVHVMGGHNSTAASIVEMDKYLSEPLINKHDNPLLWWSERQKVYPRLYEIVKRRLCIMATSVPCERLFSKAGLVLSDRRSRLKSKKVSQILFLNHNI